MATTSVWRRPWWSSKQRSTIATGESTTRSTAIRGSGCGGTVAGGGLDGALVRGAGTAAAGAVSASVGRFRYRSRAPAAWRGWLERQRRPTGARSARGASGDTLGSGGAAGRTGCFGRDGHKSSTVPRTTSASAPSAASTKRSGASSTRPPVPLRGGAGGPPPRHVAERLTRAQREDAAPLAAPPAQRVHVMDPAVDQRAAARAGREPPAPVAPPAARDQLHLARLAQHAGVERAAHPAQRGHEAKVLGGHEPAAGTRRRADHAVGLVERARARLFAPHAAAGGERAPHRVEMPAVWRADHG